MTKLCQQYLSEVKTLFPILGRPEKKYLTKLAESVEDYCAEENVTTMAEIVNGFGQPSEVVNTYITGMDSSELIKRIRFSKWIKRGIIILILIALIGLGIYWYLLYQNYKVFEQESFYFREIQIID